MMMMVVVMTIISIWTGCYQGQFLMKRQRCFATFWPGWPRWQKPVTTLTADAIEILTLSRSTLYIHGEIGTSIDLIVQPLQA